MIESGKNEGAKLEAGGSKVIQIKGWDSSADFKAFSKDGLVKFQSIGKPQLENLCFDRAMDTIYQYT